ncbi:hypothetical protein LZ31DRAFT_372348 [Colletotrichum somersetense]|nr:hypothetical protein LZ31DRAFT_372348 [Colletotrichum somersetense]
MLVIRILIHEGICSSTSIGSYRYASQRHALALAHAVENPGLQFESHDAGLGVKLRGENDEGVHLATALRCHSPGEAAGKIRELGGLRIMMKSSAEIVPAGSIQSMRRTASCELRIHEMYESPTNIMRAIQKLLFSPKRRPRQIRSFGHFFHQFPLHVEPD